MLEARQIDYPIEYEQVAYPIAGLFMFFIVVFFWNISRLGDDR